MRSFLCAVFVLVPTLNHPEEDVILADSEDNHLSMMPSYALENDDLQWITVRARTADERTIIEETGLSIEEVGAHTVAGIAPAETIEVLEQRGFIIESKVSLEQLIEAEISKGPAPYPYPHYSQVYNTLQQIVQDCPGLASLFSIGKTIQGREIWMLRLNTSASGMQSSNKPGTVFIGTIHAREHVSTMIPLEFAEWLCTNSTGPTVEPLLEKLDIYIAPLVNPDGSEYDLTGNPFRCYRKNMRINSNNKIGVDLNRNFGYGWGGPGTSNVTGSDTYRGPYAFSEPETRAIKQFFERRNNIRTFVSYHTYGELILYPWGGSRNPIANELDRRVHNMHARRMAELTGYRPMQASKLYIASGDATDWAYSARGVISFTIEISPTLYGQIGCSGFYPNNQALIDHAIEVNKNAALYLLSVTGNPYKSLPIFDDLLEQEEIALC